MSIQDDPRAKQNWLFEMTGQFPIDSRVRVVRYDKPEYIGTYGKVQDYDLGDDGDYPAIQVKLDSGYVDLFYPDGTDAEIIAICDTCGEPCDKHNAGEAMGCGAGIPCPPSGVTLGSFRLDMLFRWYSNEGIVDSSAEV